MTSAHSQARQTERLRRFYDNLAPRYDRSMRLFDKLLLGDGRRRTCARASGDTLELAIGTALNVGFYPQDVQLTGIDLSSGMLTVAARRIREIGREADLCLGDAQAVGFPDNRFDTVVCTLSLCAIPDERRALAEALRVLRPGGRLLLLEHVRSPLRAVRSMQRLIDPLMMRLAGDHLLRDPLDHLSALGFSVEHCDRSKWGIIEEVVARKR